MDRQKDGWVERLEYIQMDRQLLVSHPPRFCCILLNPPIIYSSDIALVSVRSGLEYCCFSARLGEILTSAYLCTEH